MIEAKVLDDAIRELRKLQGLAERAMDQVSETQFTAALDSETNSIALVVKHVAGNMRSRWRDFLTSDGEKPDRDRDREFVLEPGDTRERLLAAWRSSWSLTLDTISALRPDDLTRSVTIRGEPHTVLEAILRQLTHYAYHVGQIVLCARHHAGARWRSLSIPRGKSRDYDVAKDGTRHLAPPS